MVQLGNHIDYEASYESAICRHESRGEASDRFLGAGIVETSLV